MFLNHSYSSMFLPFLIFRGLNCPIASQSSFILLLSCAFFYWFLSILLFYFFWFLSAFSAPLCVHLYLPPSLLSPAMLMLPKVFSFDFGSPSFLPNPPYSYVLASFVIPTIFSDRTFPFFHLFSVFFCHIFIPPQLTPSCIFSLVQSQVPLLIHYTVFLILNFYNWVKNWLAIPCVRFSAFSVSFRCSFFGFFCLVFLFSPYWSTFFSIPYWKKIRKYIFLPYITEKKIRKYFLFFQYCTEAKYV